MTNEMRYCLYMSIIAVAVNELLGYFDVYPLVSMAMKAVFLIFTLLFTYFLVQSLTKEDVGQENN